VAQALIREALDRAGSPQRTEVVRLSDLSRFHAAFLCNSATPAAEIVAVDAYDFPGSPGEIQRIGEHWRSQPRQKI